MLIDMIIFNAYRFISWLIESIQFLVAQPFFKIIISVIAGCLFLYWLFKDYKKWDVDWLSDLIDDEIDKATKQNRTKTIKLLNLSLSKKDFIEFTQNIKLIIHEIIKKIKLHFKNNVRREIDSLYLPSATVLIIILALFALIFVLSHNSVPYKNIFNFEKWWNFINGIVNDKQLSNIVSILSGFVSIVFVLIIFIAESIRDSKNPEDKRTLLKVSYLWPITAITTLSLLNFLWFDVTVFSIILPVIIAIGIIISVWNTINFLIYPEFRDKNRKIFIKDRISRIILDSVRERIGNSILLKKIGKDKDIRIEYLFSKRWLDRSSGEYLFFESTKEGWLCDINFFELKRLVNRLEYNAPKYGFSTYQKSSPSLESSKEGGIVHQSKEEDKNVKKIYLLKRYGEYIPPDSIFTNDSKAILAIPKEFNSEPYLIKYVRNSLKHIFRFNKKEPHSKAFRRELQSTKDQLIAAIKSLSLGAINDIKQNYLDLAEIFLEMLHRFGGGFSSEQAKQERANFLDSWNEINWLNRDIRELIIIASETNNRDVISEIAFLPMAIATRAIQAKDHLLFQEFVVYSSYLYYIAKDKPKDSIRSFMIERSWRYLKEISDLYIETRLNDAENESNVSNIKLYEDFAVYVLRIFQNLLKSAFDYGDLSSFEDFLKEFDRLYKHFDPENDHPNARFLEQSLSWAEAEDEKINIKQKISFQQAKEESASKIKLAKQQVCFGLASKIFEKYKQNQNDESIKGFFETITGRFTDDLVQLTKIYDSSRNYGAEDQWGWLDWDMIHDGEVHSIDFLGKLDNLYCVLALRILRDINEKAIEQIKILPTRNLVFLSEDRQDANLTKILNSITSEPDQWNFVLDKAARDKIPALKDILKNARHEQEKQEQEFLINSEIDINKLNEFKAEIKKSFYKSGYLRPVLNNYKAYNDLTSKTSDTKIESWGYNQIDDKAAFIKDWHVSYIGWGENYGQGMSHSEDQIVFEKMVSGTDNQVKTKKQDIISEIEKVLNTNNYENPVIIQTLDRSYEYEFFKKSEAFISRYRKDCPKHTLDSVYGYMGILNLAGLQIPIIDISMGRQDLKNKVIITTLHKFCILNQYSPVDKKEESIYKYDIFLIKVIDLNKDDENRQKIINQKPDWLEKQENKEGYLRQKVLINFYEKFEFKVIDPKAAHCITIELDADAENK